MSEHDADTLTPLDGEDGNVTGLSAQFDNTPESEYETRGKTTVATRRGYRFVPSDKDLPVIHSGGVKVTAEVAAQLIEEAGGEDNRTGLHIVTDNNEEETDDGR